MDQPVAVGAEALEVVKGGSVPFCHFAHVSGEMVNFDTCLGLFGCVMRHWIETTAFTRKPAMCSTKLRFLCLCETKGSFTRQVAFQLCTAFTPFPVDVSFAIGGFVCFALRHNLVTGLLQQVETQSSGSKVLGSDRSTIEGHRESKSKDGFRPKSTAIISDQVIVGRGAIGIVLYIAINELLNRSPDILGCRLTQHVGG